MKVLSSKEYNHIISWLPSGKSFLIHKPKAFTVEILPEHFKSAKYSSFTRKLHRWGFMRHYRGEEAGAFFHDDFLKGRIDLVDKMTCYKQSGEVKPAAWAPARKAAVPAASVRKQTMKSQSPTAGISRRPVAQPPTRTSAPRPQQGGMEQSVVPTGLPLHVTSALEELSMYQRRASLQAMQNSANQQQLSMSRDLNAVIEREVSRRLEERINEVAASQQALAVAAQRAKLSALQHAHLPLTPSALAASPFLAAWNQPGSNMSMHRATLNLAAQNLYGNSNYGLAMAAAKTRQMTLSCAAMGGDAQSLGSLPTTNIQSAKTA
jgi:HSF-type DNA-binding